MLGRSDGFIGATVVRGKPRARGERGQGFVRDRQRSGFEIQELRVRKSRLERAGGMRVKGLKGVGNL